MMERNELKIETSHKRLFYIWFKNRKRKRKSIERNFFLPTNHIAITC